MVQVIRPPDVHAQLDAALVQRSISLFADTPGHVDQSTDHPPAYPAAFLAPHPVSAPAYTAQPSPTERVISRTESGNARVAAGDRSRGRSLPDVYVNKSSRLVLDLGRRVWASQVPAYGANASVSGKVLVKKSDHALNLCITVRQDFIAVVLKINLYLSAQGRMHYDFH